MLIHSFNVWDGELDRPWLPCPPARWCGKYADRMPTTLLSPGHTRYFTSGAGGFVVRPRLARVRCSYARDGHSTTKQRGCGTNEWCNPWEVQHWSRNQGEAYASCAWRPNQLYEMMREQAREAPQLSRRRSLGFSRLPGDLANLDAEWVQSYNEVILDADEWVAQLPGIIEAVFLLDGSSPTDQQRAIDAHAAFLNEYSLSEEDAPLLSYDPQRVPPFTRHRGR